MGIGYKLLIRFCPPTPKSLILLLAHVRVAISKKANKIDFPDTNTIVTKQLTNNAMVLLLLVDLLSLD